MKLYFSPFSCALAVRIAAYESGQSLDFEQIDLATKAILSSGGDYHAINPKGLVPALVLDDGTVLTENAAVLQYVADRVPEARLAPPPGSIERVQLQTWLNYIAAEVHKLIFSPIFRVSFPPEARDYARGLAPERFGYLADALQGREWLAGDRFTIADAYLAVMLFWAEPAGLSLAAWPELDAYRGRLRARPAVAKALTDELSLKA